MDDYVYSVVNGQVVAMVPIRPQAGESRLSAERRARDELARHVQTLLKKQ